MPPKKKGAGGSKGGKKKAEGYMIDGVSTTEMTREQLEVFAHRLREEIEREREERNFFELERDKIHTFWEITQEQLEESRAELRNKDREIEESEEKHQAELEMFKQKVKLLMYEQQNDISELKAEGLVALKLAEDSYMEEELKLLENKKGLKASLLEQQLLFQKQINELNMWNETEGKSRRTRRNSTILRNAQQIPYFRKFLVRAGPKPGLSIGSKQHSKAVSNMRSAFSTEAHTIQGQFEKKLADMRSDLALRHRIELSQVEEQKNKQISELIKNHEKAFSEMKNYYDDITLNNLALNGSLKEQIEKVNQQVERMEKQMHDILLKNKQLEEPLEATQVELADLRRKTANYDNDKISLSTTKIRLNKSLKKLEDLKCENEVLQLRFEKLQDERDEMHKQFAQVVQELQQKATLRATLLEEKVVDLMELLEQKEAQITEVLAASRLDPAATAALRHKLDSLLDNKNTAIKELQYELARVSKAHDDLLRTFESKLHKYGIPKEELGFTPLQASVKGIILGKGPAGLVAANR